MAIQRSRVGTPFEQNMRGSTQYGQEKKTRGGMALEIFHKISDAIAMGHFSPGERLDENTLAARYQVSRTPVREALKQLSSSGLVVTRPNHGCRVAQITPQSLDQLFEAIGELEATCARHAVTRMTDAQKVQLCDYHAQSRLAIQAGDANAYDMINKNLHLLIIHASHNPFLIDMVLSLRQKISMFRRTQFNNLERMTASFEEHSLIVEALLGRDVVTCYREMRAHLFSARAAAQSVSPAWRPQ